MKMAPSLLSQGKKSLGLVDKLHGQPFADHGVGFRFCALRDGRLGGGLCTEICLAFHLSAAWVAEGCEGRHSEKAAVCSTEDTEGVPDGAGLTHGEKWSGSILEVEPQDFLMDWAWSVSERGDAEDCRVLGQTKQQEG